MLSHYGTVHYWDWELLTWENIFRDGIQWWHSVDGFVTATDPLTMLFAVQLPAPQIRWEYIVGWMQEGRKCIFAILQEKQFCTQISFVFHCFLTSYFFHKHINTLSWDLRYGSKCVILPVLLISIKNSISPKMSLTTFLHSHDDISSLVS